MTLQDARLLRQTVFDDLCVRFGRGRAEIYMRTFFAAQKGFRTLYKTRDELTSIGQVSFPYPIYSRPLIPRPSFSPACSPAATPTEVTIQTRDYRFVGPDDWEFPNFLVYEEI